MVDVLSVKAPARDRYFDTLRALAIMRVVAYHAFHYAVLALLFPSMGVMFALAGSLMAKSLDRSAGAQVIRGRVRRLLPALWVMGAVLVPLMLIAGWGHRPAWPDFLLWVVPLATPPASHGIGDVGAEGAGVLWYLATYLWLVLLSPVLLKLYRRQRLLTIALPLVVLAALHSVRIADGNNAVQTAGYVLTFLPCWLLGFAHRDGDLRRIRPVVVAGVAVGCAALGLGWVVEHPGPGGLDLVPFPLAHALYSMGFVLALLRLDPGLAWLNRMPLLQKLVAALNNRAVTIYLWHNVIITVAIIVGDRLNLWDVKQGALIYLGFTCIALSMLAVAVFALGWVEDLAARRPPRLRPWPVRTPKHAAPRLPAPADRGDRVGAAA
ncbi:acyltransferase family protein [Pseudosporangium ferrugineum]|uniref:Peptidoglycan/LPS O-acetylase OafA/YrhL n=1 Tax=Pseudosporangium ferrugineum TaxID=439699 RepID=A0A2T0SG69_9ACTN|nr:acyltransferase [Pseudosporangium ferrugineum]PRY32406.1 peptidoglycan/LPS O-acetylase OafA/YrhL [Pseudosporangium ferrugineum]